LTRATVACIRAERSRKLVHVKHEGLTVRRGLVGAAVATFALVAALVAGGPRAHADSSTPRPPDSNGTVRKASAPKPINYDKLTQEAVDLLAQYVKTNTTDPPGNELPAAKLLREKFLSDGVPATIWQPQEGRGIIAARLHGTGHHNKAIVLLSHMDVAPANPKEWQVPPFSGEVKDGELWGRGSLDDKGPGVIELMAMLAIKRAGILLNRDVLFIATGDEEEGGRSGAGWLVDHESDVFTDAGYLLNEGGEIVRRPNGREFFAVSVTEKPPLWLKLTASGPPGHASVPPTETSVTRLVHALDHLGAYHPQIRISDTVRDYFKALAKVDDGPSEFFDLASALQDGDYARQFLAVPRQNALVRDTLAITVLSASQKTNIIPATASAEIDCRLLPGEDPQRVLESIRKAIGDDIKIDVMLNFPAISSPHKSLLMDAIAHLARTENGVPVVPTMIAGFTDSHYFRQKGLIAYGFIPIEVSPAAERGVHGIDERISVKQLGAGIKRMVDLLEYAGGFQG
jgi:acetylornithine deacetylase/succinyl-diaminopimelate desuccinylase-like protein